MIKNIMKDIVKLTASLITITMFLLGIIITLQTVANSAEQIMQEPVTGVTVAVDKNGNEYVRAIVNTKKSLNGIEYQIGVPVMAFSTNPDAVAKMKTLKKGDKLNAIVSANEYQGRTSYTVIQFIN